jgi:hypothetical protein
MTQPYEEIECVQAANAEIVISELHNKKGHLLVVAPRKSYYDADAALEKLYIPRFSSIEFSEISQVEDFLASLFDACRRVFNQEPRRMFVSEDENEQVSPDTARTPSPEFASEPAEMPRMGEYVVSRPSVENCSSDLDHEWFLRNLTPELYCVLHLRYGTFNGGDFCKLSENDIIMLRGIFVKQLKEFAAVQRRICISKPPVLG